MFLQKETKISSTPTFLSLSEKLLTTETMEKILETREIRNETNYKL